MKRKIPVILLVFVLTLGISFSVAAEVMDGGALVDELSEEVEREMDAQDLQMDLDVGEEYIILDVRSTAEREEGYIPGSEYVNFGQLFFQIGDLVEDPEQEFIVACQSGARSVIAVKLLQDMGYENPINLEGGFMAWEDAGFEVETP